MDTTPAKYPVTTLIKALSIIEVLAKNAHLNGGMRINEIDAELHLGKSTIHRLLETLMTFDYVEKNESTSRYRLGWNLYTIGQIVPQQNAISKLDYSCLDALCLKYGATLNFGVYNHHDVLLLYKIEPDVALRISRQVGQREPLHATALGRVLISEYSQDELQQLASSIDFRQITPCTKATPEAFLDSVALAREQGFATEREEYCLGAMCYAYPVRDHQNAIVGAISISGPLSCFGEDILEPLHADLLAASQQLSAQLGQR